MNHIKRIIDNKNSVCKVEYTNGNTGFVHIDRTTEAQRKAYVREREEELREIRNTTRS